MPSKNSIKQFQEDGFYHIYNRGVEKRDIFVDKQDYKVFFALLKLYLSPPDSTKGLNPFEGPTLERPNFYGDIDLFAYCLMPNHFHLLIKQKNRDSISKFMKCVATNYVMYFNKRHDRVGSLFQGIYKAVLVKDDSYVLHLSRYIHLNPAGKGLNPFQYEYSSYADYLGQKSTKWVNPQVIQDIIGENHLNRHKSYKDFVENYQEEIGGEFLKKLTID